MLDATIAVNDVTNFKTTKIVRNCRFDSRAYSSIGGYRNGYWILENNVYGGSHSAIHAYTTAGFYSFVTVDGGDFTNVTGDSIKVNAGITDSGIYKTTLRGTMIGAKALSISNTAGTLDNLPLDNTRIIVVTAIPAAAGLKGDTAKLDIPVLGSACEWICITGHAVTATWRMVRQAGVKKDTTANRVAPAASDVGLLYLDTTLDADGYPIFWQGTKFIKSDGTDT
jgi:hypothetical protein